MNKKEFLDLLGQSLSGEVDNNILEQSIKFYNEYISSQSNKSEQEVIEEIGDPRLIAKTIIETENTSARVAGNRYYYDNHSNRSNYNDYAGNADNRRDTGYNKVYHVKWYHMVAIVLVLLFVFTFIVRIGWFLLRILFLFFMPIIVITLLWAIIRKR